MSKRSSLISATLLFNYVQQSICLCQYPPHNAVEPCNMINFSGGGLKSRQFCNPVNTMLLFWMRPTSRCISVYSVSTN